MKFDPDTTAVIAVDLQQGFCNPEGSLYAEASEQAVYQSESLITKAREAGVPVIFTRDVHPPEQFDGNHYYDEFDRWGEHLVEGTWETELAQGLNVREEDHVVEKHTYDAFYQTNLEGHLDSHQIDDLLICGTLANVCVLHTAGSAGLRDYRPVIVEDAVGFIEADHREYAIDHAAWLFGERTTIDDVEFE